MSSEKLPRDRRRLNSAADAAERLAAIVEAAEKAASAVIDDAEEQARRHIEEARERADRVVAERLRELADELDPDGIGHSGAGSDREAGPAEHGERRLRPVQPPAPEEQLTPRRSASAGARLLATQMAISGASRGEIEERLRNGFDIVDTGEILEAILGPEED
jgi:cell division septum initiation protein DivIVA